MKLWTIQKAELWEKIKDSRVYRPTFSSIPKYDNLMTNGYRWLAEKMRKNIGKPKKKNAAPVWAWDKKPDLRSRRDYLAEGQKGVRIGFEMPNDQVAITNFDGWHNVINYWYLGDCEEKEGFSKEIAKHGLCYYKQKPLPIKIYHDRLVKSWDRVFDLEWNKKVFECDDRQATCWELPIENIFDVREFVA